MSMIFDTKVAVVLRDDLAMWQKLNVTAFLMGGLAGAKPEVVGEPYEDGSGNVYFPMIRQPIMIFAASREQIQRAYDRAMQREVKFSIFTEELFATGNDIDNRAAVKAKRREELAIIGMAMHDWKKTIDKVLDGLALHK